MLDQLLEDFLGASLKSAAGRAPQRRSASFQRKLRAIFDELSPPLTVRQVFYQAVVRGLIKKTEVAYQRIIYHLTQMRRNGDLPYGWIADNTRWMRKPTSYRDFAEALEHWQRTYRRDFWANSGVHVEVWLEKEAMAGVAVEETGEFDVPLMVSRGFSSISFLYEAAQYILQDDGETHIYYLGDMDRAGRDVAASIEQGLVSFGCLFTFTRLAVTPDQVEQYNLPTRPEKRGAGRAVEVDALPPSVFRQLIRSAIFSHIDADEWNRFREIQEAERQSAGRLLLWWGDNEI